jgi:phenylalanyl-tRNA synthetase alpha chain
MLARLTDSQVVRDLDIRDLTDPGSGPHAIQMLVDCAVDALESLWNCEVRWCRGDRIVSVSDNYDNLGFDPADVTRDARYTRYVDDHRMFRSHSSAMVPPALRRLGEARADDVLLVCPGIVFRRDAIDRLHTGTPHQLDLWRISRRPMTDADMDQMISALAGAMVPGADYRSEARVHPYTLNGRQVDIDHSGEWVEVWECGLAHPAVLAKAGLDTSWSGLALGMGLDRLLMLAKNVPDIRALRSTDPRIESQMLDLEPYRTASSMPAVTRDLSIAVDENDVSEDLGDRVRDALGDDARSVEEVSVLSETQLSDLPAAAITRLGARADQKNVLVRVVLRDLERTLTDEDANAMRDDIYAALHQGDAYEWAVNRPDAPTRPRRSSNPDCGQPPTDGRPGR